MCPLQQRKCVEEYHRNKSDKNSEQQLLLVQHFVGEYRESEGLGERQKTAGETAEQLGMLQIWILDISLVQEGDEQC